jgi:hypothetical protein
MSDFDRRLASEVEAASPQHLPPYADVLARRDRRRTRRRTGLAVAGAVVLVGAVLGGTSMLGGGQPRTAGPVASPSTTGTPSDPADEPTEIPDVAPEWDESAAPPVVLQLDGREVVLDPWSSCYSGPPDDNGLSPGMCVDGFAQRPFEDAGDRGEVAFSFPLEGWSFTATFSPLSAERCERRVTVPVEATGDHTFLVPPAGPAGDHRVDLFGQGPEGSVSTTFRWSTSRTGFLPEPSGYVGLLTDAGDTVEIYPLEMGLADLAETPRRATATVTVTDADGDSEVFGPVAAEPGCWSEGGVLFRGGESGAAVSTDLGPGPFTYRAEVTLDGTTYVGTGVWPRDERRDEAPYTDLVFDPPLPGYAG